MKIPFLNRKRKYKTKPRKPVTLEDAFQNVLIRKVKEDPEWAFKAATRKFNLALEPEDDLEILKRKKIAQLMEDDAEFAEIVKDEYIREHSSPSDAEGDLQEQINQAAMVSLAKNPALMEKAVSRRIESLMGRPKSGNTADFIEQLESLEELQERLGGNKSQGFKITPELLTSIIENIPAILGKGDGAAPKVYVIEKLDGTLIETNATGYQKYLEDKPKKQIAAPQQVESKQLVEPKQEQTKQTLNLSSWLPYLDQEPEIFVSYLTENLDPNSQFIISVLKSKTADELISTLQQFKARDTETKEAIEKLEQHKEWLEKVIALVRGISNAEV